MASDHAGFELKEALRKRLEQAGHEIEDVGTHSAESVDYPPFAARAAGLVAEGRAERGVLVCGSGNGVAIVANKVPGIRAVNAHDAEEAEMCRRHNDANVLTLSGQRLEPDVALVIAEAFLAADFDGGRHERRVGEISDLERTGSGVPPQ
jgi:ribose 5-phosphate isomerase B